MLSYLKGKQEVCLLLMSYLLVKATDRFAKRKVLFLSLSNFMFLKSGLEVIVCVSNKILTLFTPQIPVVFLEV